MFNNFYRNKKVLVTGNSGFKGSWLVLWLKQLGADVYGISLDEISEPSHFSILNQSTKINHSWIDIKNFQQLSDAISKIKPDIVFHLAAKAIVSYCQSNPLDAFHTNVLGTVNLLESLKSVSSIQATVMITSDKCYENVEWEYGYRENDRLGGKDPYSASKACAELAISSYVRTYFHNSNNVICSARAGNVIGGGDWAKDRIVPDCIRAWREDKSVLIRNPESTRPWQHVLEPLSGYLWLAANMATKNKLSSKSFHGESYNFGPQAEVNQSVEKLIESMKVIWPGGKWSAHAANSDKKITEAKLLKLCCDKALADLNWKASLNFEQTAKLTATWYKEYYENPSSAERLSCRQISEYEQIAKERKLAWTQT
jgi:CDP-glucose 4,6-dehydratase